MAVRASSSSPSTRQSPRAPRGHIIENHANNKNRHFRVPNARVVAAAAGVGAGGASDEVEVVDLIEAVMASPVRSRLLKKTLEYSIERTMTQWRAEQRPNEDGGDNGGGSGGGDSGGGGGGGSRPMSGQTFRRWLNERLGRNLYVGDAATTADAAADAGGGYANSTGTGGKMSPGGMLLSTLGDRCGGGGEGGGTTTWTGRDLALARNRLRAVMQRRLDVRCVVLEHHRVHVVTRPGPEGEDTNLVTSGVGRNAHAPPAIDLAAALALDNAAFAVRRVSNE